MYLKGLSMLSDHLITFPRALTGNLTPQKIRQISKDLQNGRQKKYSGESRLKLLCL
jgi:hypothetical protein